MPWGTAAGCGASGCTVRKGASCRQETVVQDPSVLEQVREVSTYLLLSDSLREIRSGYRLLPEEESYLLERHYESIASKQTLVRKSRVNFTKRESETSCPAPNSQDSKAEKALGAGKVHMSCTS